MPPGKGGYHTIALYLNTFSQHMWAFKYKMAGMAKTTVNVLSTITKAFIVPKMLMTDGSTHFNNNTVQEFCDMNQCKHHVTLMYSPWVNGLVEGMNKILLHVMKWLCTPKLGEDNSTDGWDQLPQSWPDQLDEAVNALNHHILPTLKFSPKELLLGIVINTPRTKLERATTETPVVDTPTHIAYVAQQHLNGYETIIKHAITQKHTFDRYI
jgi:hypothetical protein